MAGTGTPAAAPSPPPLPTETPPKTDAGENTTAGSPAGARPAGHPATIPAAPHWDIYRNTACARLSLPSPTTSRGAAASQLQRRLAAQPVSGSTPPGRASPTQRGSARPTRTQTVEQYVASVPSCSTAQFACETSYSSSSMMLNGDLLGGGCASVDPDVVSHQVRVYVFAKPLVGRDKSTCSRASHLVSCGNSVSRSASSERCCSPLSNGSYSRVAGSGSSSASSWPKLSGVEPRSHDRTAARAANIPRRVRRRRHGR